MSREVVGVMPDGVKILKPITGGRRLISDAEALEAVRKFRTKGIPMGSGWKIWGTHPRIHGHVRPSSVSIAYEKDGAPNHCYRLWCWAYADTDLF